MSSYERRFRRRRTYVEKFGAFVSAARQRGLFAPGTLSHINVLHDDGCPTLTSGDGTDCTCEPDFEVLSDPAVNN